jgi:hypothetical protein
MTASRIRPFTAGNAPVLRIESEPGRFKTEPERDLGKRREIRLEGHAARPDAHASGDRRDDPIKRHELGRRPTPLYKSRRKITACPRNRVRQLKSFFSALQPRPPQIHLARPRGKLVR